MEPIQLLVCLDENYMPPLRVMLASLFVNNQGEDVVVWLLHKNISQAMLNDLAIFCERNHATLRPIVVDGSLFSDAPVLHRYTQEMYFRLLAPFLLPDSLHKVLYLDPDILIINQLRPLWDLDMKGRMFAAAVHTGKTELANNINRIRLKTEHDYFNSGVLLIDLDLGRREIIPADIFKYVKKHEKELLLPDQDILNSMYGSKILELDDEIWNYDARKFSNYLMRSSGRFDVDWVMDNTAILHFCGNAKPWKAKYRHRFGILYKHYIQLTNRL